ncbi:MAG: TetR/AcrR family transcriptional regulator [Hungatella sp.]|jgi:AcrR family transcriptional regulator|nr:TetR/AcrR family transcriptional regulator [Hungatella sp.]
MNGKADRRIIKSRNVIQSAFLTMLITDGFDKITVKGITEKADISRKTFYLHYVDKYDLLDTIVNMKLKELEKIAFFSALFKTESTVSFRKQLLDFIANQLNKKINKINSEKDAEILLRFLSMAVLGIVEAFVLNEFNIGTEQLAKQVGKLLAQNISLARSAISSESQGYTSENRQAYQL